MKFLELIKSLTGTSARAVGLWAWVLLLLLLPNLFLMFTERLPAQPWAIVAGALAFMLVPASVYLLLTTMTRNIGKNVWIVGVLLLLSAFQMVLLYLFGRSVIAVDMWLNLVIGNASEASELIEGLLIAIIVVLLVYIPPFVFAVVGWRKKWLLPEAFVRSVRRTAYWIGIVGIIVMKVVLITQPRVKIHNDMYPVNVAYNAVLAVERIKQTRDYHKTSESFSYNATAARNDSLPETYILVVGETARADHFQLFGYERPTTPMLIGRLGLIGFSDTKSESNTTYKSVPMLLSHLDARTFGDSVFRVKSIASAFGDAGFRTAYFSTQQRTGSFIDFFAQQADTCVFLSDNFKPGSRKTPKDKELLALVDNEIKNNPSKKKLIILHTYGSHFRYNDRYPSEEAVFPVGGELEASPKYRDRLVAAYDNTIYYTASLLDSLINRLDAEGNVAGLLYVSDHGEDIYDDESKRFLHSSPMPSVHQVSVPLIMWMSEPFIEMNPAMHSAARANSVAAVSSSRSVFHTLLQMAGIEAMQLDTTQSLLSPAYREPIPRLYLNDHNSPVELEEMLR